MSSNNIVADQDLEQFCNTFFWNWQRNYESKKYSDCTSLVNQFIAILKPIYKDRSYGNSRNDQYSYIYIFLIFAKGLGDIIELVELTKNTTWTRDNKKTEGIWYKLWDAKERLAHFAVHSEEGLIDHLTEQLDRLESVFYDVFGKGIYASPEILIKKAICSVCGENIKGCMHIPGNIYDGFPCRENVIKMELLTVSLVQAPYDMRCRVWPWNITSDWKMTVRVMNLNKIDSFLHKEQEVFNPILPAD